MISYSIKEGFGLTNRNLQLVIIRIVVTLINIVTLLVFMGVPLVAAVIYLGFDLSHAKELLPGLLSNPLEFISRYFGAVMMVLVTLLFYLSVVSMISLYVLGGTIGVLRNALANSGYRFNLSSFFKEASRNFSRVFWVLSLVFLILSVILIVIIIAGGAGLLASQALKSSGSLFASFFSSLLMVTVVVMSILVFICGFVFSVYSIMTAVMEEKGSVESVRETYDFLKSRPQASFLYVILMAGSIVINVIFFGLKIPFSMIPLIAPFMNIVLTLMNAVVQSYVAVFIWSALVAYYVKAKDSALRQDDNAM